MNKLLWSPCLLLSTLVLAPVAWAGPPPDEEPLAEKFTARFEAGERAFDAARRELLEKYVETSVTEEQLYRAAVQGMLAAVDPPMRRYNRLLGPEQLAELHGEMKGEVVGVGLVLKHDAASGRSEVLGVVPGSPAAKSDAVKEGDMVLAVDGQTFKGKGLREVVVAIRGKEGEKVRLSLLRDTRVVELTLERRRVQYEVVELEPLPGEVAVLRIEAFNETTPGAVRAALAKLGPARGLVVDLRGNEGGLLEKAIETAKLFVPKGQTVLRLLERGGKERAVVNEQEPAFKGLPLVVVTHEHTGSSAELLAAALREQLKAPLIGARTQGKWSVQQLRELPNRYVMKYTVAHFRAPDGRSFEGEGLPPDFEVPMELEAHEKVRRLKTPGERLAADPQLKAAVNFLRMR